MRQVHVPIKVRKMVYYRCCSTSVIIIIIIIIIINNKIGATRAISKSFRKYASNIPGNHEVRELQKTAILGTGHVLLKVLM
jgi:hypothetical protein